MVKGWGELRSLAPFSWDTRVDDHPPGQAAMRDFSDAYAYARSTERPRRSTSQYAQTPTPLTSTKRRLPSSGKEGGSTSHKRLARAGQDKENEHTPSTAYASSRLALASPAFLTPARSDHPTHPSHEVAAARSVPACPDAVAHSTPSVGTALTHITPSVADAAHSTPTSEAGSGGAVLALRALVGPSGHAHSEGPAHSAPCAKNTPEQSDAIAQHHRHQTFAEAPMHLNATSRQQTAVAQQPSSSAKQHLSGPDGLAGVSTHSGGGQGDNDDAEQTMCDEGQPLAVSPAGLRQLAPAGPALGCPTTLSASATADRPEEAAVHIPDAAVAQWPDAATLQVMTLKADTVELKHHAESSAVVKFADAMQSQDQIAGVVTDLPVPKTRLQLQPGSAEAPMQQLSVAVATAAPLLLQSKPAVKIVASPGEPAQLQHQTAETMSGQSNYDMTAVSDSPVTTPAMDAEHQAAVPVAASRRRSEQQLGGKNSRRRADDRQTGRTRMSLRSQTQVPNQKRRKVGGSRADRGRAAQTSGPANGYATRTHGADDAEGSIRHSSRIRSQQAHTTRTQPHSAARATSSDLAAAEALAELRHENEAESNEQSDMECEVGEEGGPRKGASGYDGIFRVTQPPLPLWVAGMQLDKQGTSRGPLLSDSKQSCPPVFRSPAASGDWSIGGATPVLQVLPRHRWSAAAAAEAMLGNGSPLSGLHKLALSICARKKGTVAAIEPSALPAKALGVTSDKENVSPVPQMQSSKPLGAACVLVTPALERDRPASVGAPEAAHMEADQLKTQQSWDKYVANKLSGGKDGASQAELISTLQRELTQPGLGLLARACLLLRLEDARAGLLYSQYHGILAACTAEHGT
ncbi:hypothetical protein WJX77_001705 [Trebouxia sp. C0004]